MQHILILKLRIKPTFSFLIKSMPLLKLVKKHSVLFLLQTNLSIGTKKVFILQETSFLILLLKKGFLTRLRISFIFTWEEKHFFHFFIWRESFRRIVNCCFIFRFGRNCWVVLCSRRCTTKSLIKCSLFEPLVKIFEK